MPRGRGKLNPDKGQDHHDRHDCMKHFGAIQQRGSDADRAVRSYDHTDQQRIAEAVNALPAEDIENEDHEKRRQ